MPSENSDNSTGFEQTVRAIRQYGTWVEEAARRFEDISHGRPTDYTEAETQREARYFLDRMRESIGPLVRRFQGDVALTQFNKEWVERFTARSPLEMIPADGEMTWNCEPLKWLQSHLDSVVVDEVALREEAAKKEEAARREARRADRNKLWFVGVGFVVSVLTQCSALGLDVAKGKFLEGDGKSIIWRGGLELSEPDQESVVRCAPLPVKASVGTHAAKYFIQSRRDIPLPYTTVCQAHAVDAGGGQRPSGAAVEITLDLDESTSLPTLKVPPAVPATDSSPTPPPATTGD